jgi:AbiV family abortive infection protein
MVPDDILSNAERLVGDAKFLFSNGRARSASTLIVVALEQLARS